MAAAEVGSPAPAFELEGTAGPVSLESLRGRWVVLAFYPGDFTKVCTKQFCSYRDDSEKLEALDAVVLGISHQDLDSHRGWIDKHSLTLPLLADVDGSVGKAYGVHGPGGYTRRAVFIVDPEGIVRQRRVHKIGLSFEDADWIAEALTAARAA